MNQINKLLLCLLFFSVACGKTSQNKKDDIEILTKGTQLYSKYGCAVCHSLDGTVIYGPPLNEIYMKNVKVIRNGKEFTVIADREYLKKAITEPRYDKVLEYKNKEMPLTQISEEETDLLVDYIIAIHEKNQTGK
jgi:mono/diheme cytochrome c family protein